MLRIFTLAFVIAYAQVGFADDAGTPHEKRPNASSNVTSQLLDRISDLEKRVAELEATMEKPRSLAPSTRAPRHQSPGPRKPYVPRHDPNARRLTPHTLPVPPSTGPQTQRDDVPKSWQPFYFNDRWYYMVPADDVAIRRPDDGR